MEKTFLLYLSVHWGDLIEEIKICHIHFKMRLCMSENLSEYLRRQIYERSLKSEPSIEKLIENKSDLSKLSTLSGTFHRKIYRESKRTHIKANFISSLKKCYEAI